MRSNTLRRSVYQAHEEVGWELIVVFKRACRNDIKRQYARSAQAAPFVFELEYLEGSLGSPGPLIKGCSLRKGRAIGPARCRDVE